MEIVSTFDKINGMVEYIISVQLIENIGNESHAVDIADG